MVSINTTYIFILCITLPQIHAAADWTKLSNEHLALANATVLIVREHFSAISTTVVIVEKSVHPRLNTRLMEYVLHNLQETVAVQLYLGQSKHQPWDYHIFVVDSAEAFREVHRNFPETQYERKFRFLIILTNFTRNYFQVLRKIFTLCYELHVLNANVVLNHPRLGVCMYTYKLFTEYNCRLVQPMLYFQFKDGFENLKQVFPRKLFNFYGCPIRVSARQNPPLLIFSGNKMNPKPKGYWKNLNGIDGQLIRIISRSLNFTIDLQPFPMEGTYFDDNNGTSGCFSELLNDKADIAIGGFSASDPKRHILSASIHYHYSPVVFVVRGGRESSWISRLAKPFTRGLWIMVAIFIIFVIFAVHILRNVNPIFRHFIVGERIETPLTNFFAIFLGYSINQIPRRNFARYVLLLWLMTAMILRNAYQGALYDSIRLDKFVKIPLGYEQLLKWNYHFMVSNEVNDLDIFPKNDSIVMGEGYELRFNVLRALDGRYAVVALRDNFFRYIETNSWHDSGLKLIKEPLYLQLNAMYFPKHSIYKSAFNKNLRQFNYGGITRYIARTNAKEVSEFEFHKTGPPPKRISNDRLRGMYAIYVVMMALAVIVFALELLSVYSKKVRSFIELIS